MTLKLPSFDSIAKRNEWLVANKSTLIDQKKMITKEADASFSVIAYDDDSTEIETKASTPQQLIEVGKLTAKLAINSSNFMDSHCDVHIQGLWKKSIQQKKTFYLLNQHKQSFDGVISDSMEASTELIDWSKLNLPYEGKSQVLLFTGEINGKRNPFMFEQYANGYVKEHSVGMRYVQITFCLNDDRYKGDFEAWEKYRPMVANGDLADQIGYFWAVTEAKIIEGSAVLFGSNSATPTLSIKDTNDIEPPIGTQITEPPSGTQKAATYLFI
jgi:hypothetical protein